MNSLKKVEASIMNCANGVKIQHKSNQNIVAASDACWQHSTASQLLSLWPLKLRGERYRDTDGMIVAQRGQLHSQSASQQASHCHHIPSGALELGPKLHQMQNA
jgi:hypothetical protein